MKQREIIKHTRIHTEKKKPEKGKQNKYKNKKEEEEEEEDIKIGCEWKQPEILMSIWQVCDMVVVCVMWCGWCVGISLFYFIHHFFLLFLFFLFLLCSLKQLSLLPSTPLSLLSLITSDLYLMLSSCRRNKILFLEQHLFLPLHVTSSKRKNLKMMTWHGCGGGWGFVFDVLRRTEEVMGMCVCCVFFFLLVVSCSCLSDLLSLHTPSSSLSLSKRIFVWCFWPTTRSGQFYSTYLHQNCGRINFLLFTITFFSK